jgi:mannan endo-1,4-beta-mannosidase
VAPCARVTPPRGVRRMINLATRRDVFRGAIALGSSLLVPGCASLPQAAPPPVPHERLPGGLEVRGARFYKDGAPFFLAGINHWAASTLARESGAAGWDRVRRDLDALQALGINVIRTMGATEGPDTEPLRVVPSIQPREGTYESAGVAGVLRLADEVRRRGLYAIVMLNNFWPWSGGMAQYLAWAGEGPIPYPPPAGASWESYEQYTGRFYANRRASEAYDRYIRFLVPSLRENPAIVWELANEPRGMTDVAGYRRFIDRTARLIKSLAPGQLVTTGSEGETAAPWHAGLDVVLDHQSPAIDFVTFHLWAQNWGWVRPESVAVDYPAALDRARLYVEDHVARAAVLNKPIVLEEFGFPRDGGSFDPLAPTTLRDRYFEQMYELVGSLAPSTPLSGILPWAWSGDARPPRPGEDWRPGDALTGDPPHERQGWYGIYGHDSTGAVVREGSARVAALARRPPGDSTG